MFPEECHPEFRYRQCIFSVFGGKVAVTGEILHGKTSLLQHDSKGIFQGLAQNIPVTRYHSLAGTHLSLPQSLEITSWIANGSDDKTGIIMGVRHKEFVIEGVQFHPESILTQEGSIMLANFLQMKGGTWKENQHMEHHFAKANHSNGINGIKQKPTMNGTSSQTVLPGQKESILETIFRHRRCVVEAQMLIPSQRLMDLQISYDLNIAPPQVSFPERLKQSPYDLSLMAEIKRASPSKGIISWDTSAPFQARKYALAGASVISVLTEPEWFKGSIEDLRAVRQSLEGMPNRPAVLRKEFIFNQYQILEARLAGADTVLLIVKMLEGSTLQELYHYSRSLGMEPLVEVNTVEEMDTAVKLGALVIGVNNRNLSSFDVDLETTSKLTHMVSEETILCALSGISKPEDVQAYKYNRVGAVLVGEALMRASDAGAFVDRLLGGCRDLCEAPEPTELLIKICGTRTPEAAKVAIEAGADLIGIILVEGRKRCVSQEVGQAISRVVKETAKPRAAVNMRSTKQASFRALEYFEHSNSLLQRDDRALLVGVFLNQPLEYILSQQKLLDLDIVQLHGSEPPEWASLIPVPVIRRFGPMDPGLGRRGYHAFPLLDAAAGGTGRLLDLTLVQKALRLDDGLRIFLAGGLNSENLHAVFEDLSSCRSQVVAVDVSTGVEEDGVQSLEKIEKFISAAKSITRTSRCC